MCWRRSSGPGDLMIFDNRKVHSASGVEESIKNVEATVLPLPPC
jgi:hypothetical protein